MLGRNDHGVTIHSQGIYFPFQRPHTYQLALESDRKNNNIAVILAIQIDPVEIEVFAQVAAMDANCNFRIPSFDAGNEISNMPELKPF